MSRSLRSGTAFLLITNLALGAPDSIVTAEIEEVARPIGGAVGVAAWRLDGRGPRILVNERAQFPMASTYKIAIAGTVFAAIDAGGLRLDQLVAVDPAMHVPSEVIEERFIHPGVSLSVHNLLELMLTQSDNTATDVLMKLAGGAPAVTEWVQRQAGDGQRIDRDTAGLLRDFFGFGPGPFKEVFVAALQADPKIEERSTQPNAAFDADPRDTSTPEAMSRLLSALFNGKALSPASTTGLKAILERCRTVEGRLKGRLPAGSVVAHKTGTVGGSVNDVGVITLPQGKGHVVISVFIKQSAAPVEARERVIAEIARSVRDFYLFAP